MPLVDSNDPASWGSPMYVQYRPDGTGPVGYERSIKDLMLGGDVDKLVSALATKGLQKGQRIALVGAGFGWVAERLNELGYGPIADGTTAGRIVSIDTSTWIQANKTGNAVVPILNSDINNATGRRALRQALGSNNQTIDWGISEDILPILTDNETQPFADAMRQLSINVAHFLTVGVRRFDNPNVWAGYSPMNWKALEDWKALMSPDYVVQRGTSRVL